MARAPNRPAPRMTRHRARAAPGPTPGRHIGGAVPCPTPTARCRAGAVAGAVPVPCRVRKPDSPQRRRAVPLSGNRAPTRRTPCGGHPRGVSVCEPGMDSRGESGAATPGRAPEPPRTPPPNLPELRHRHAAPTPATGGRAPHEKRRPNPTPARARTPTPARARTPTPRARTPTPRAPGFRSGASPIAAPGPIAPRLPIAAPVRSRCPATALVRKPDTAPGHGLSGFRTILIT